MTAKRLIAALLLLFSSSLVAAIPAPTAAPEPRAVARALEARATEASPKETSLFFSVLSGFEGSLFSIPSLQPLFSEFAQALATIPSAVIASEEDALLSSSFDLLRFATGAPAWPTPAFYSKLDASVESDLLQFHTELNSVERLIASQVLTYVPGGAFASGGGGSSSGSFSGGSSSGSSGGSSSMSSSSSSGPVHSSSSAGNGGAPNGVGGSSSGPLGGGPQTTQVVVTQTVPPQSSSPNWGPGIKTADPALVAAGVGFGVVGALAALL